MARLPASATAGDRELVEGLPDGVHKDGATEHGNVDSSNDSAYRPGPRAEGDPGWSEGFSLGGNDLIR